VNSTKLYEGKNNHIDLSTHYRKQTEIRVRVMVCNVTLNNISIISWRLVLLVEETGELGENQTEIKEGKAIY
jgi:hypothetical protein